MNILCRLGFHHFAARRILPGYWLACLRCGLVECRTERRAA